MRSLLLVSLSIALVACVGDSPNAPPPGTDAGADTGVPLGPNDVTGLLTDAFGSPLATTKVMVDGTIVTSDADGKFIARNVAKKYDVLAMARDSKDNPYATSYLGLTTRTPVINAMATTPSHRISILTHVADPTGGATLFGGAVTGGTDGYQGYAVVNPTTVAIGLDRWVGPSTVPAWVFVFSGTRSASGELTKCAGYARSDMNLTDGNNIENSVTLAPIGCSTFDLTPTGVATATVELTAGLIVPGNPVLLETSHVLATVNNPVQLRVPAVPGTKAYLMTRDSGPLGAVGILRVRNNVDNFLGDVPSPAPIAPSLPADGATAASLSTAFTWAPYPNVAVYRFFLGCAGANITIYTADTSAKLPSLADINAIGAALPNGESCSWLVDARTTYASVDDWAAPSTTLFPSEDGSYPTSPQRMIKFAP